MALIPSPPCRPLIGGPARQVQLDYEPDDLDQLTQEVLKQRLLSIPASLPSHAPINAHPLAIAPQTGRGTVGPPGPTLEVPGIPSSSALVPYTSPSPPKPTTSSGPLLLEAPKDQRQRWAAILAADPNFAHFIRPLHEDLSAALTPYTPKDGLKATLPPYTPQDDDARGEEGAIVPTPVVAEEQAEQVVKKAGGLEELIAFAEALCLRAEKGDLMTGGGPIEVAPVCKARTVDMELRMEVRTQGLQGHGGRPTGKVAVGAKVRAYSPQLLREYPSNVGGEGGVRRAPIILVELTDAHLEQAVTRFFRLYEELFDLHCPDYERPTLFIFADLTSTRLSHRQQLDLLKKIGARLQQLEQEGKPAYREAASRVFFNDANAHIQGLSLASSNDLILSTIRRSSVCGLNFLRCMTGRDVLRLCRYKVGDAAEEEGRQLMSPNGDEVGRGLADTESHRKEGPTQEMESQSVISGQGGRKSPDKRGLETVTGAGQVVHRHRSGP